MVVGHLKKTSKNSSVLFDIQLDVIVKHCLIQYQAITQVLYKCIFSWKLRKETDFPIKSTENRE